MEVWTTDHDWRGQDWNCEEDKLSLHAARRTLD
jgi:hypothetical protein